MTARYDPAARRRKRLKAQDKRGARWLRDVQAGPLPGVGRRSFSMGEKPAVGAQAGPGGTVAAGSA